MCFYALDIHIYSGKFGWLSFYDLNYYMLVFLYGNINPNDHFTQAYIESTRTSKIMHNIIDIVLLSSYTNHKT